MLTRLEWRFRRALGLSLASLCTLFVGGCCGINSIGTESLPDATVGQPYSFELEHNCTGKSSTEAADWRTVTGTTLPPGISLSSEGRFSGTPIAPGTYSFAVQLSASTTATFTIVDVRNFSLIARTGSAATLRHLPGATLVAATSRRTRGVWTPPLCEDAGS